MILIFLYINWINLHTVINLFVMQILGWFDQLKVILTAIIN